MTQVLRAGVLFLLLVVFRSHAEEGAGAGGCVWDTDTDPEQGLSPGSFDAGARQLAHLPEITDPARCQEACCGDKDCQLALIGTPADDGNAECFLVSCVKDGKDVCDLKPATQFRLYRKTADRTQRANEANSTDGCRHPVVAGRCRAAFPRFYYDITSGGCGRFLYGGCGANGNNFESQEECEKTCAGVTGSVLSKGSEDDDSSEAAPAEPSDDDPDPEPGTPEPATEDEPEPEPEPADAESGPGSRSGSGRSRMAPPLPLGGEGSRLLREEPLSEFSERCLPLPEAGPCRAALRHFYYDISTKTCLPFIYGGCRGNKNNHPTEEMCLSACTVKARPSSKKASDEDEPKDEDYEESCAATPDPGPCRAAFTMFHYDPDSASCHAFVYGGCRGNGNRYGSAEECLARCTGEQGRFDEHGKRDRRRRWTPAFFLVATLASISVLLLAALILVSTRRGRRQRAASLSDKEELLPEDQPSMEETPQEQSPQAPKA